MLRKISLARVGEALFLSWDDVPGFKLQRASSVFDPDWSDVVGAEGATHIELPITSSNEYFRLIRP